MNLFRLNLLLTIVLLSLSFSFAQESEDDLFQLPPQPIGYTSTYTPLTDEGCHYLDLSVWHPDAPIDYFTLECPAYGGYRIILTGGDLRSWIQVMRQTSTGPEVSEFYQDVWSHVGQFPHVSGTVLEWRYFTPEPIEGTLVRPELVGIIYRVAGSDPDDLSDISKLVAVRLRVEGPPCLLGVVDGNEEARALLDSPATPCFNH